MHASWSGWMHRRNERFMISCRFLLYTSEINKEHILCSKSSRLEVDRCPFQGCPYTTCSQMAPSDRADPTNHFPHGLEFRFSPKVSCPAREYRLAPVLHVRRPWKWWTLTHPILAWWWNFPVRNREGVTMTASVSKRSGRCKNASWTATQSWVAPNSSPARSFVSLLNVGSCFEGGTDTRIIACTMTMPTPTPYVVVMHAS